MDGGQWQMFANLVAKYGVMPKSAMPEVNCCSSSRLMNRMLTSKLREYERKRRGETPGHPVCYVMCGVVCVCNMCGVWCVWCATYVKEKRRDTRYGVGCM
jgi:hypothetical protein